MLFKRSAASLSCLFPELRHFFHMQWFSAMDHAPGKACCHHFPIHLYFSRWMIPLSWSPWKQPHKKIYPLISLHRLLLEYLKIFNLQN